MLRSLLMANLALALAACSAPPTPTSTSTASTTLAAVGCNEEGFSVDSEDNATHVGGASSMDMPFGHDMTMAMAAPAGQSVCVPLRTLSGSAAGVGLSDKVRFRLESLRGDLSADAPDNEGFVVRLLDAATGKPLKAASVTLEVRMPGHNRSHSRGHGPANDMEANGLPADARADGSYQVNPVDFSMAGTWLITVRAVVAGRTEKAYWALSVQ